MLSYLLCKTNKTPSLSVYVCMYVRTSMYVCVSIYVHVCACMCLSIYVDVVYVSKYICICSLCVCIYFHSKE